MGGEQQYVRELVESKPVVVFSKTYCPFCTKAKRALAAVGAEYELIELDQTSNGSAIQAALASLTGQRTVPNVFVGGQSIGGGDETEALRRTGKLQTMTQQAVAAMAAR